ncbi:hypothetical protein CNBD1220 [Cryptococcus deneoformans B-3501A]|uniref:hypothetical protein n=1 Tax=Cryptococcus deneoformans (strain B-3501A) TaxID=283643 RepID=UPI000042E7A1|nr:hypothetical protein CNBD1220 [Cryptococcus neoformans var. neoformans B-3501A]EAL21427.1 hypothetical protein CNBD1220 [Cryptococcus neoformans var. neoformans B-3501A]
MPVLYRVPEGEKESTLYIYGQDIDFLFSAVHDCVTGGCTEDGERVVFQERQATSQKMAAVRHRDADRFVINTAAFHNVDVLLSALPRTLYQPRRILEDPWEVRFARGEKLKETRNAKSHQRNVVSAEEEANGQCSNSSEGESDDTDDGVLEEEVDSDINDIIEYDGFM